MGNGLARLTPCLPASCCCSGRSRRRHDIAAVVSEPLDEGLGHSFCYVRPESASVLLPSSKVHSEDSATTTTFRAISGASVCANTATPPLSDFYSYGYYDRSSAAFESSTSFAAIPLQPIPKTASGPIPLSGPIERGFMSGPIERGFMSGPLDRGGLFSGPLAGEPQEKEKFQRSFSHGGFQLKRLRSRKGSLIRAIKKAISKTIGQNSMIAPVAKAPVLVKDLDWAGGGPDQIIGPENLTVSSATNFSSNMSMEDDDSMEGQNLQWAQGKAGEDRVHVVVSEEHGWVFVGIYDGFNGPDAPDYLLSNLYPTVHKELKGLLWEDNKFEFLDDSSSNSNPEEESAQTIESDQTRETSSGEETESCSYPIEGKKAKARRSKNNRFRNAAKRWEENQRKWRSEWERERLELERRLKEQLSRSNSNQQVNHSDVLKAMSQALRKTEEGYLDIADQMLVENPELALMGSCVLVMLMKGEDVYLMNVGDSRAVLAQSAESGVWESLGKDHGDLERISEENWQDLEASEADQSDRLPSLSALQLSADHSTSVKEEVQRIRNEHPDDASAIVNDRVKGSLKVTRAFGAGFLKKPKWNNALLEIFRVDYVGSSPYINCNPSLYHHRLGPKDRFLILTSDGLYQYFTNEEAVAQVELFIELWPEGDPAQHLVEEVLFRAAKKAGMDFHELLEIPQGDRRRYHDDVSIIVISLEGRIWRSSV